MNGYASPPGLSQPIEQTQNDQFLQSPVSVQSDCSIKEANMSQQWFAEQNSLSDAVEELAETTVSLGVISSFMVHYQGQQRQFYLPSENDSQPLTAEEAYLRLKQLMEESGLLSQISSR
ncbi:hypothetical protein J0895_09040 [Phormidium pseudopriestleyi FRX01]|uniref:Uncharacterized protein n=1 Tax=Phormidium pseudopriestleyi FRX01 TaxID=1759528 RepID=A0ABS3FQV5_9CYAN|nr:hypothetical protein [Phormidium pseudopriestleyi]MBO0349247.1 hypothetical protein [Phormidium pseudopriestleyi FRX01]